MGVVNTTCTAITNGDATPRVLSNPVIQGATVKENCGIVAAVSGDSIASTYRIGRVRSNARVSQILISNTAITTCAGDVGLYKIAADGGAVVDADFFASAVSLATAQSNVDVTHEAGGTGNTYGDLTKKEMPLWQALGLTSDPNLFYDVVITLTAAAGSAGVVAGLTRYVV